MSKKNKTRKRKHTKVFQKEDFDSNDGFMVNIWGPLMWTTLHTISFNYPVNPTIEEKNHYRDFIINLQNVLPCKSCRINLRNNFKILPLKMSNMKNRETFSKYIYNLHEIVNKMLKKKSNLTYQDVRERYEHFRARCVQEKQIQTKKNKNREKGCTEPLYGKKAKCIINIVPQENKTSTFQIDKDCIKTK